VANTTTLAASPATLSEQEARDQLQSRIDRFLLIGSIACGSMVFAIPGLFVLAYAYKLHRQGLAAGFNMRPVIISILGVCCLVDASVNFLIWMVDLLPTHSTVLGHTLYTGMGRLWDGNYYLGYSSTKLGGTAVDSEKALEFCGAFLLYPMRLVAGWGFIKMKKWGYQYLLVNTWLYVFFWFAYIGTFVTEFHYRFPYSAWGVTGIWIMYIWFIYPFFMIPYLHTVNRDLWKD
jgi:hypothetical protein